MTIRMANSLKSIENKEGNICAKDKKKSNISFQSIFLFQ